MAKILCVLYSDPEAGHPPTYPRDGIPAATCHAAGALEILESDFGGTLLRSGALAGAGARSCKLT